LTANPDDLLKGCIEVSSLPTIYCRINEAINNPGSSMADIGKIISDDPGLTLRLLRLVNSAFYGFPTKIETITQALVIIGTKQLRDLALATSIVSLFEGIPKEFVSMESFWRHSIACGIAAKTLAAYRREPNTERFFIAGLLHDIGRLILYKKAGDQIREALLRSQTGEGPLFLAEREILGFDHAVVGHKLLQGWNLPASLEEAVTFHHTPGRARRYPIETAVVHVADIVVNALQFGSSGERFVPTLDGEAWERIGFPASKLSSLVEHLDSQVNEVIHSFLWDEGK
jgi:HD-like signal output (HDOD) protein